MKFFNALFMLMACSFLVQAQLVNVDYPTGAVQLSIPITNFTSGDIAVGVSLNYYSSGIRVKDIENNAGMGWNVSVGGAITRELRGFPDDQTIGSTISGWMLSTAGTNVAGFTILNDNNSTTCTDGSTDLSYMNSYFSNYTDTEPDIFYVNAPGLNFKLVFDKDHNFRTIPYADVKVTYEVSPYTHLLSSFTIIDNRGITYTFDQVETHFKQTVSTAPSAINVFKTTYEQFKDGVYYYGKWHLSKMVDRNKNEILLSYIEGSPKASSSPVEIVQAGASTKSVLYSVDENYTPLLVYRVTSLSAIDAYMQRMQFSYITSNNQLPLIATITSKGKVYKFDYINAKSIVGSSAVYGRSFLSQFSVDGSETPLKYKFAYQGIDLNHSLGIITTLPDSLSKSIDYWGYYNASGATSLVPSIKISPYGSDEANGRYHFNVSGFSNANYAYTVTGVTRSAVATAAQSGLLKTITNVYGGSSDIEYELNQFPDPITNTIIKGAGSRVTKITDYDFGAPSMVRNFTYINPTTSGSSGKAISVPSFAFPTVYTGGGTLEQIHLASAIRGEDNLSGEDAGVIYSHVSEMTTGAGSVLYEFSVPATHFDTSASPDWYRTVNYANMPTCASTGYLNSLTNSYPYTPNANFEFERGLLLKTTAYNGSGQKLNQVDYEYERTGTPYIVDALRIDDNAGAKVYAKYRLLTGVSELTAKKTVTTFEAVSQAQEQQSIANYYYQGADHKELTQLKTTNSDGSISRNYTKYIRDYTYTGATDDNSTSLLALKNMNVNFPVEQYSQLERSSVNKTIGASLTKFKKFNFGVGSDLYLPAQQLNLLSASGLTDFQVSAISSGSLVNDSRYQVTGNMLLYNYLGQVLSNDDNRNHISSVIRDVEIGKTIATISNAKPEEVLIGNFDYSSMGVEGTFYADYYPYTPTTDTHTGAYALPLSTSGGVVGEVKKSSRTKSYIFSIWINATGTGTGQLALTDASTTTNYTFTYTNTNGAYQRYELKIPVASLSTTLTARFTGSTAINVDDLRFCPELADMVSYSYDPEFEHKTAEINSLGLTTYYTYDAYGRPLLILDQDKNIVKRYTYNLAQYAPATYYNAMVSGTYTKNNCATGSGTSVTYTIPAGSYNSTSSQAAADALASSALASGGQNYANINGTCAASLAHLAYDNQTTIVSGLHTGGITSLKIKNSSGTVLYTFSEAQLIAGVDIPTGTYTLELTTYGTVYNPSTHNGWGSMTIIGSGSYDVYNTSSVTTYTLNSIVLGQGGSVIYVYSVATVS